MLRAALILALSAAALVSARTRTLAVDCGVTVSDGRHEGTTTGAAPLLASPCGRAAPGPTRLFRYVSPRLATVTVDLCESEFDTVLTVWRGCPRVDGAVEVGCSDDACGFQSRVQFLAEPGETHTLQVSGYDGARGDFVLRIESSPPGGADACELAVPVELGVVLGDTRQASNDGAASCGDSGASPDVWFVHEVEEDGDLFVSTCGSDIDTVVSLHTDCPGTPWNATGCDADSCGLGSEAGVRVRRGDRLYLRVAGERGAAGPFRLELDLRPLTTPSSPDLAVAGVEDLRQVGREGDVVALAAASILCNRGDAPVAWAGIPAPSHPFLVFEVYRIEDGTIAQIGQSWAKHGIGASQGEGCGGRCVPFGRQEWLGPGCSDVYSTSTNASRQSMGPRHEIDPHSGGFTFEGSFLDGPPPRARDSIAHRLRVLDEDLDPARHPGAEYLLELQAVSADDRTPLDNLGWKRFRVGERIEGTWDLELEPGPAHPGPACLELRGAATSFVEPAGHSGGGLIVLSKADRRSDGAWRYHYAVFNADSNEPVRALRVALGPGARAAAATTRGPLNRDDGVSDVPWFAQRAGDEIRWESGDDEDEPLPNTIRWGQLRSFEVLSDAPPASVAPAATLVLDAPDGPRVVEGVDVVAPGSATARVLRRGDVDSNGHVEVTDAIYALEWLYQGGSRPACVDAADTDDDGRVLLSDAIYILRWLFASDTGGAALGGACAPDETPSPYILAPCDPDSCRD